MGDPQLEPVPGDVPRILPILRSFGGEQPFLYNDAELVDSVCGAGTYERVMPAEEVAILQLARPLYQ